MRTTILTICTLLLTIGTYSQSNTPKVKPFQCTFFYPLGTSGAKAANNGYITSINVIAGVTGSANGFEIGSIANLNRDYNCGAQIAGICNITGSYSSGAEIAGICNLNGGPMTGAQFGGIGNIVKGSVTGVQVGGIFNLSGRDFYDTKSEVKELVNERMDSAGMRETRNHSTSSVKAVQVAGIVNLADNANALQLAGISNVSGEKSIVQVAGIGNLAPKVEGIQIGGIFNIAGTVKGVQLAGIINICDSINGVPIALVSIVRKNGYRRFEVWTSEAFYMNLSFKIGVRQLYSVISLGYKTGDRENNIGLGVGLGTNIQLAGKNSIDLEGHMYQISRYLWMDEDNFLYTVKFNYVRNFNEHLALFVGPTMNMLSARINSDAYDIAPGYGIEHKGSTDMKYWAGFNAGFRF